MEFGFGEGVDWSEGGLGVGFQVDGMVIGAMRGKVFGFAFCEDVRIIVVLRGNYFFEDGALLGGHGGRFGSIVP